MPDRFYQTYWKIVGEEVTKNILKVLNNQESIQRFNKIFITLIPKKHNPLKPTNYRPIALNNVIMKIITKTIANRIRSILRNLISEKESAFVHK